MGKPRKLIEQCLESHSGALQTFNLPLSLYESVLHDVLHSIRSFLRVATNSTPQERFLFFNDVVLALKIPSDLDDSK